VIQPYCEYHIGRLAELSGVPEAELLAAVERKELPAVKASGRKGEWRVLGARYIEWQESRHSKVYPGAPLLEPGVAVELLEAVRAIRMLLEAGRDPERSLPPDVWTREEAAKYLGVSARTLNRWKRDGLIQFVRIGNVTRYRKEWLDEFIREQSLH
jgi:excisionase family DNA binding protein